MNCKQGDLAIVISGNSQGMVVECLEFVGYLKSQNSYTGEILEKNDWWRVTKPGGFPATRYVVAREKTLMSDAKLRPIRGTPETEDEDQREPVAA